MTLNDEKLILGIYRSFRSIFIHLYNTIVNVTLYDLGRDIKNRIMKTIISLLKI